MAVPALVLVVASSLAGAKSPVGFALLGAAVIYLLVDLFVLQPRIEATLLRPEEADVALEEFLIAMGEADSVEEVTAQLGRTLHRALGPSAEVALVAPDSVGGIRLVCPNPALSGSDIGDPAGAFLWLGHSHEPLWRSQINSMEDSGARDTAAMMDAVGAKVLLPLRHRGLLLGILLLSSPALVPAESKYFLRSLRVYATAAIANTFLDAEARGRSGLTETLGLANAIQESLMPEERPVRRPEWELRGLFRPVAECGGDLWNWRELPNEQVLLVIADATGHGAGPALLSAVAKGTIDAHAQVAGSRLDPGELLRALNHAIYRVGRRHYMMTAFAMVIDIPRRHVRFSNAAQNFPFLIRGGALEALVVRGDALGAREDATFETHERPIHPGDKFLLFTDGIVEAGSPATDGFGERRFRRLVQELSGQSASYIPGRILDDVTNFLEGEPIHDDVTLVAFEYTNEELDAE